MSDPIVEITHVQEFSASHRLHNPALSDAQNRELYGICNNPNGHGHNYAVEVSVRGPVPDGTGMVMDLNRLSRLIVERLIEPVEHKHLNFDVPFLEGVIPTAENVAVAFWRELEPALAPFRGARLSRIRVRESRMNYVDYFGPQENTR
ncbi:MAG TPA: 6-carboxytetrahydropterin synthase [Planctomycetota bacterium]|nr:6-carboxytetrahydropterin synthase [Planctomycetota bacterium]